MIRLTDEEKENPYNPSNSVLEKHLYDVFKAGAAVQLRKVVEWMGEKNSLDALKSVLKAGHTGFISNGLLLNSADWQSLLEEVK